MLYGVVEEHLESFYRALGEQGASLPAFVHAEFERYLRCGRLRTRKYKPSIRCIRILLRDG